MTELFHPVGRIFAVLLTAAALGGCVSKEDDPRPSVSSASRISSVSSQSSSKSSANSVNSQSSSVSSPDSVSSQSSVSSNSSFAPVDGQVTLSGRVTYDFVPLSNTAGLQYNATEQRPVRGAVVRLLNAANNLLATTHTDDDGHYSVAVDANTQVRLQVLAQSLGTGAQKWDIQVQDNTSGNGLYAMGGDLASSGVSGNTRNLHAPSGWEGSGYSGDRVAAPFAILDTAYEALEALRKVDSAFDLPVSYFRWSRNNTTATGNIANGDIGTSFYGSPDGGESALYILGEENVDTDEYDRHVIAHEWAHYLEDALTGRLDSLGGSHSLDDALDKRVAWSEGFSNAFSAIVLDNPIYRDSFDPQQARAFGFNIASTSHSPAGWFNEGSVQSIVYNFSEQQGFDVIYNTLTHNDFKNTNPLISIFTFNHVLSTHFPGASATSLSSLLNQQQIHSVDPYGEGETNNGGIAHVLPLYRVLTANGATVNVCSNQRYGTGNTLGVDAFLRFTVPTTGSYTLRVEKTSSGGRVTDPDFYLFYRGNVLVTAWDEIDDIEEQALSLQAEREYIVTVNDWNDHPSAGSVDYQPSCFDVTLKSI